MCWLEQRATHALALYVGVLRTQALRAKAPMDIGTKRSFLQVGAYLLEYIREQDCERAR